MDTLSFSKRTVKSEFTGKDMFLAVIEINGQPLDKIIEPLEREIAQRGGEKYPGFGYDYQFADILFEELLTQSSAASGNEVVLMICSGCFEEGCWPLLATVEEYENSVTWSKLHNHHRSKPKQGGAFWDYSAFPTFRFEKENYDAALISLLRMTGGTYRYSTNHRKKIEKDTVCGCFACGRIFHPSEIEEWCAEEENGEVVTALCPYCDIDAVIGESARLPVTAEVLRLLNKYSF
jgi:hypothetical protein